MQKRQLRNKSYKSKLRTMKNSYTKLVEEKNGKFLTTKNTTYQRACELNTIHSVAEAEAVLKTDMEKWGRAVYDSVKVEMTDNMYNALISFSYNIGIANFKSSSTLRNLNSNKKIEAANSMLLWNKSTVDGKKILCIDYHYDKNDGYSINIITRSKSKVYFINGKD